jgi:uncharacterized repeat protein (TIGR02543 family)
MKSFLPKTARFREIAAFCAAALLVVTLAACTDLVGGEQPERYTVTFDSQRGSDVPAITGDEGTAVQKPADPTRTGYEFLGWYNAASGGTKHEWPRTLTGDVTMYAQWKIILTQEEQEKVNSFKKDETVDEALKTDTGTISLDTAGEKLTAVKDNVDAALETFGKLTAREQEALSEEKAKLNALKEKMESVSAAQDFQDTHGEMLGKNADALKSLADVETLLPGLAEALETLNTLRDPVKELLVDDIARLEDLKDKVGEIVNANVTEEQRTAADSFRKTYADILTPKKISPDDEKTVDAAIAAYSKLGEVVKFLLLDEYELLTGLKEKIAALKPVPPSETITYTAAANGSAAETSTTIDFTFSAEVSGLTKDDIAVTYGANLVPTGELTGNGKNWSLAITVDTTRDVLVSIYKTGIEKAVKTVEVYKAGETSTPSDAITYNRTINTAASTAIDFTPGVEVSGLAGPRF